MNMHESGEMYLETILRLSEKNAIVRSIDVAQMLGYSKPSISRAMKNLKENGYISINPDTGNFRCRGHMDASCVIAKIKTAEFQKSNRGP